MPAKTRPIQGGQIGAQTRQLPLEIFPMPTLHPGNPISYISLLAYYLARLWDSRNSHSVRNHGHYSTSTRSVIITDDETAARLWSQGFFGKGSLSRSEPEWMARQRRQLFSADHVKHGLNSTAAEITSKRRQERKEAKRQRAQREAIELEHQLAKEGKALPQPHQNPPPPHAGDSSPEVESKRLPKRGDLSTEVNPARLTAGNGLLENLEHLQLAPEEAFYLSYGLGILDIYTDGGDKLSSQELFQVFSRTFSLSMPRLAQSGSAEFLPYYAVYHHYRSLGWVVRPGIKFSVDFLLYARGPIYSHAEFAVIVAPRSSQKQSSLQDRALAEERGERDEWWYVHSANRVQNQVLKTLVIAYVDDGCSRSPGPAKDSSLAGLLGRHTVREFVIKRWTANRNRGS